MSHEIDMKNYITGSVCGSNYWTVRFQFIEHISSKTRAAIPWFVHN